MENGIDRFQVVFEVDPEDPAVAAALLQEMIAPHRIGWDSSSGRLEVNTIDGLTLAQIEARSNEQIAQPFQPQPAPVPDDDDDDDDVQAPVESEPRWRLEREGDMFRLYAVKSFYASSIGTVYAGARGGLVWGERALTQEGTCWVENGGVVKHRSRISGSVLVGSRATVGNGTMAHGEGRIVGDSAVDSCHLSGMWSVHSSRMLGVSVTGSGTIDRSILNASGRSLSIHSSSVERSIINAGDDIRLEGVSLIYANLRSTDDVLSVRTRWGALSAFRCTGGNSDHSDGVHPARVRFKVGCQTGDTVQELRDIADNFSATEEELELLELFWQMVRVVSRSWGLAEPLPE